MYGLFLNPMTANAEATVLVGTAETREKLIEWMEREAAPESYMDGRFRKTYEKQSPLENFNPPMNINGDEDIWGQGIRKIPSLDEWLLAATDQWRGLFADRDIL